LLLASCNSNPVTLGSDEANNVSVVVVDDESMGVGDDSSGNPAPTKPMPSLAALLV
jgi:hypothetical protein